MSDRVDEDVKDRITENDETEKDSKYETSGDLIEHFRPGEENDEREWKPGEPLPEADKAEIDLKKFESYSMDPNNAEKNQGKWEAFEQLGYDVHSESGREMGARDVMAQLRMPVPTPYPPAPIPRPHPPVPVPTPTSASPVPVPSSTSIYGPFPSNMPTRVPDLEGMVAIPPVVSEIKLPHDWSTTVLGCIFFPILLVLRPFLLIMGLVGMSGRTERKMTINTVRLKRSDGTLRDVRFEGDLMGAGISLGDELSIWGNDRSGVLVAHRAYNHTGRGEIQVRHPYSSWGTRIVAIVLLLFLLVIVLSIAPIFSAH